MRQLFVLGSAEHEIGLTRPGPDYRLLVGDEALAVSLRPGPGGRARLSVDGRDTEVVIAVEGDVVHAHLDGETHSVRWVDPVSRYAGGGTAAAGDVAAAPMPGTVVGCFVEPGQDVAEGEALLVIESMKLETTIRSARAGQVETVHVRVGSTFERGARLVTLAALS